MSLQPATFTPDGGKVEQRLLELWEGFKVYKDNPQHGKAGGPKMIFRKDWDMANAGGKMRAFQVYYMDAIEAQEQPIVLEHLHCCLGHLREQL